MLNVIGIKYYDPKDTSKVYRCIGIDKNTMTLLNVNDTTKRIVGTFKEIRDNFVKLNSDNCIMLINNVETSSVDSDETVNDVFTYVYVNGLSVFARQSMIDPFNNVKNGMNDNNSIYFGSSIYMPNFKDVLDVEKLIKFNKINDSIAIYIYMDDKEEDIINMLKNIDMSKFNKTLSDYTDHVIDFCIKNADYKPEGLCKTYIDFFKEKQVMLDIYKAFGMLIVNLDLDKDDNETKQGIIHTLNCENKTPGKVVTAVYVQPYSKKINLNEIKRSYVLMISTITNKVYIVGYDMEDSGISIDKEKALKDLGFNII